MYFVENHKGPSSTLCNWIRLMPHGSEDKQSKNAVSQLLFQGVTKQIKKFLVLTDL